MILALEKSVNSAGVAALLASISLATAPSAVAASGNDQLMVGAFLMATQSTSAVVSPALRAASYTVGTFTRLTLSTVASTLTGGQAPVRTMAPFRSSPCASAPTPVTIAV